MLNFNEFLEQQQAQITFLLEDRVQKLNNNLKDIQQSFLWTETAGNNLEQKLKALEQQGKERYLFPAEKDYQTLYQTRHKDYLAKVEELKQKYGEYFKELEQNNKKLATKHEQAIINLNLIDFVSNLTIDQTNQGPLVEFCSQFDKDYKKDLENAYIQKIEELTQTGLATLNIFFQEIINELNACTNRQQRQEFVDDQSNKLRTLVQKHTNQIQNISDLFAEELFEYKDTWYKKQDIPSDLIYFVARYIEKRQMCYGDYSSWGKRQLSILENECHHKFLQTEQEIELLEYWQEEQTKLEDFLSENVKNAQKYIQADKKYLLEMFKNYQLNIVKIEKEYDLAWIDLQRDTEIEVRKSRIDHSKLMVKLTTFYEKTKVKLMAKVAHLPTSKTDIF